MQTTTPPNVMELLNLISEKAEKSKFPNTLFEDLDTPLSQLAAYFKVNKRESLWLSICYIKSFNNAEIELEDLADFFDCSLMKLLNCRKDLENLCKKGYLEKKFITKYRKLKTTRMPCFLVNEQLFLQITDNKPIKIKKNSFRRKSLTEVLALFEEQVELIIDEDSSYDLISEVFHKIFRENLHSSFIQWVYKSNTGLYNKLLFLSICWECINGSEDLYLKGKIEEIFKSKYEQVRKMQQMVQGKDYWVKNKQLELTCEQFVENSRIKLTAKTLKRLEDEKIVLFFKPTKEDHILMPEDIAEKTLFYDPNEARQYSHLQKLLHEEHFNAIQARLAAKGNPKGVNVLLHGYPGTGKTEMVLQLARQTGRSIYKVDISDTKSPWFGESEKKIKSVFNAYESYCKTSAHCPILLFNEADAVLSKRKDVNSGNVAKTENAIQNILLEALENFNGLLFATTNLLDNLDTAFDRRFLFKLQFEKPSPEVRAHIWASKLPQLNRKDCLELAERFNLSGGEINNVLKKADMDEVLYGTPPTFDTLIAYAREEGRTSQRVKKPIGFGS
ncbi:MAG: ATP-binding protein [Flavobacteriaceae bacterium]